MHKDRMIKYIIQTLPIFILLVSCDPGHHGNASIDNQTNDTLILKYQTRYADTIINILPMQKIEVLRFGGIGEGKMYPGVLIEFKNISLRPSDTTKSLTKEITNIDNWEMINENKRRFSSKKIKCWFTILPTDIK